MIPTVEQTRPTYPVLELPSDGILTGVLTSIDLKTQTVEAAIAQQNELTYKLVVSEGLFPTASGEESLKEYEFLLGNTEEDGTGRIYWKTRNWSYQRFSGQQGDVLSNMQTFLVLAGRYRRISGVFGEPGSLSIQLLP